MSPNEKKFKHFAGEFRSQVCEIATILLKIDKNKHNAIHLVTLIQVSRLGSNTRFTGMFMKCCIFATVYYSDVFG